jgi:hypothetical protein
VDNYAKVDVTYPLHGYDVFKANALAEAGDSGFRYGKIFNIDCDGWKSYGGSRYYRDFASIRNDLHCSANMQTTMVRTVQSFLEKSTSHVTQSSGLEVEASVEGGAEGKNENSEYGFSAGGSYQYESSRESSNEETLTLLRENRGELLVADIMCFTHDVSISYLSRSRFTPGFLNALHEINASLVESDVQRLRVYERFIDEFGTHFVRKAQLGASLTFTKLFNEKSTSANVERARKECFSNSVGLCFEAEVEATNVSKKEVDFGANFKVCMSNEFSVCTESEFESSEALVESVSNTKVISKGSRPTTSLNAWATSTFKPVPIRLVVEPITNLINPVNLGVDANYGIPEALDVDGMMAFFEQNNKLYCQHILGLTTYQCNQQLTGDRHICQS